MTMKRIVDLRSDTLTRPSAEMRRAMAEAEVGDDVFGEDPSVNLLEEEIAARVGKEAALYVPSGTMANQIAIRSQAQPGDEILLEADCHVFNYESGGASALAGLLPRQITGERGMITPEQIELHLRGVNDHYAPVSMVLLENTHNVAGGTILPIDGMRAVSDCARAHGLAVHVDGARIFNASIATGISAADYAACCDTLSICFSKGLGAPVGSVLTGTRAVITRARRFRKMLGGGMRQVGILAAAARYALAHNVARLADDHARARRLAAAIGELEEFSIADDPPDTNIILVNADGEGSAPEVCTALAEEGLLCLPRNERQMRLVTHLDLTDDDITSAIEVFRRVQRRS